MPTQSGCGSSINEWTLPALIGSYLDLLLAFILLIGSTLVYIGSKILSFLGLRLPCPCDGLFGCPACVHSRIGSAHRGIRTRFPYDVVFNGSVPDSPPLPAIELPSDGSVVIGRRPVMKRGIRRRRERRLMGEGVSDNFAAVVVSGEYLKTTGSADLGTHDVPFVDIAAQTTECESQNLEEKPSNGKVCRISEGNELIPVEDLEQELEEAQAAYSALCIELEKERNAAATAADEAMAMILRLQREKAAVEMESSQYRRMIEEKFSYDEEEMDILKEIIVRREREKLVLEKEVEAYRQMITGEKNVPCFNSPEDPTELLKTIYESVKNKEKVCGKWNDYGEGIHQLDFSDIGEELPLEVQEKGMLTMDIYPSCEQGESSGTEKDCFGFDLNKSQESDFGRESPLLIPEEVDESENKTVMEIPVDNLDGEDGRNRGQRDSNPSHFEIDLNILDVHVIDEKGSDVSQSTVGLHVEDDVTDIRRSCSDMPKMSKLVGSPGDASSDLRRNSMSAVDRERFKLETEVEILHKRLKTIQQDREKLTLPIEHQAKEASQLELLEEIASQLKQIRKVTDPGKAIRQASLPPLPSKANPKKRRCRSVSWGLHESA